MSHKLVSLYIGDGEYYTRTDADAVIAELKADYKEACGRLQTANLIKDEQLAATRHQKYMRCLTMVRCCMADNHTLSQVSLNEITNHLKWLFNVNFFVKWAARWSKIADKFKEGV